MLHTKYQGYSSFGQEYFLNLSCSLPLQPEFGMESKSLKNIKRGLSNDHFCEVGEIPTVRCLKQIVN